jgi:tetratricopeptide (TPR) repeat protein
MGDFCHLERGKYRCLLEEITPERVWEACQGVLAADWQAIAVTVARARDSVDRGDGNTALNHLAQLPATLANPEVAHLHAHALALLGQWENATRAFSAALAAFPNAEGLNRMGLIFYANRRYEQCAQLFRLVREWNQAFRPAQVNGMFIEAKRCLDSGDPLRGLMALELFANLYDDLSPQERKHASTGAEAQELQVALLAAFDQRSEVRRALEHTAEAAG